MRLRTTSYVSIAIVAAMALAAAPGAVLGAGPVDGRGWSALAGGPGPGTPEATPVAPADARPGFAAPELHVDGDETDGILIPPIIDPANPQINKSVSFSVSGCSGQRSKIKDTAVTDAVVVGKAGPIYFAGYAHTRAETNKGWGWSFSCVLKVDYLSGTGSGGVARKVTLYSTANGVHESGDECVYDGITLQACTASVVPGEYLVSISGETWGYPTRGESCVSGYAQNSPQYSANEPVFGNPVFPSVRTFFDSCENDTICWKNCDETLAIVSVEELLQDLGLQED